MSERERLRALPSVDGVLLELARHGPALARAVARDAAREVIANLRVAIRGGAEAPPLHEVVALTREAAARTSNGTLRPVINASGVILQTNLGRAPLSERAITAMADVARVASNLEYDLDTGERGSRHAHVREMIRRATGAEDGIAVNNNAAALFFVLQAFAQGREVIVSRGQAVEIGGGFRIPDVLRQSGARLVEVGTTNRTYTQDFEAAIGPETAAILRVHSSNFRVVGFTAEAPLRELSEVTRRHGVLLLDDLGSGCLLDTERFGMAHEPTVQESLAAGADLAMFSGDKLLGGPQCGIIAGRTELVERLRKHPLARALRVDKLTIAALNATLAAYVEERAEVEIPVWQMVAASLASLRPRARKWAEAAGEAGTVVPSRTMVGGGSLPGEGLPTWCAAIRPPGGADVLAARLRNGTTGVIPRIDDGAVLLDPRCVRPADDRFVTEALRRALSRDVE